MPLSLYPTSSTIATLTYGGESVVIGLMMAYCRAGSPSLHDWLAEHLTYTLPSADDLQAFKCIREFIYTNDINMGTARMWREQVRPWAAYFNMHYLCHLMDQLSPESCNLRHVKPDPTVYIYVEDMFPPLHMRAALNNPLYADCVVTNGEVMMYAHTDVLRVETSETTQLVLVPGEWERQHNVEHAADPVILLPVSSEALVLAVEMLYTTMPRLGKASIEIIAEVWQAMNMFDHEPGRQTAAKVIRIMSTSKPMEDVLRDAQLRCALSDNHSMQLWNGDDVIERAKAGKVPNVNMKPGKQHIAKLNQ